MSTPIFLKRNQKVHGPFDSKQLKKLASASKLFPDDLLSYDQIKWTVASRVKGLIDPSKAHSSRTQSFRNSTQTPTPINQPFPSSESIESDKIDEESRNRPSGGRKEMKFGIPKKITYGLLYLFVFMLLLAYAIKEYNPLIAAICLAIILAIGKALISGFWYLIESIANAATNVEQRSVN